MKKRSILEIKGLNPTTDERRIKEVLKAFGGLEMYSKISVRIYKTQVRHHDEEE